jgi:hypothetical protein
MALWLPVGTRVVRWFGLVAFQRSEMDSPPGLVWSGLLCSRRCCWWSVVVVVVVVVVAMVVVAMVMRVVLL